jgi:putative transport protein
MRWALRVVSPFWRGVGLRVGPSFFPHVAIGYHFFKINPAVLMGGVAGARSHSGPAREASKEIDSSVPWVEFPVGYAMSGVLLTVFGYFAMLFTK